MRFVGGRRILRIEAEIHPIRPPEFNRVLCPIRSVAAAHGIGRAIFLAAPADALRMARMQRNLWGHAEMLFALGTACIDKYQFDGGSSPRRITESSHGCTCARRRSIIERARDG